MDHLLKAVEKVTNQENDSFTYLNWSFRRVFGGMNGITYHVEDAHSPGYPLAVKIRKRDERNRALREFSALQALRPLPVPVAPKPISIHTNIPHLPGDVVVSSWINGNVLGDLENISQACWESILATLSTIHSIQPADAPHLMDAVNPIRSTPDIIAEIERRYARLPDGQLGEITKAEIGNLFEEFKSRSPNGSQFSQQLGLILCDTNPSNMIETDNGVVIVDWENSGWADPAFDIADLLVRPECARLTKSTREWLFSHYAELMQSQKITEHIIEYEKLMLIFWLILTSNGFIASNTQKFTGTRNFTLEQTKKQQIAYLKRIEMARSS